MFAHPEVGRKARGSRNPGRTLELRRRPAYLPADPMQDERKVPDAPEPPDGGAATPNVAGEAVPGGEAPRPEPAQPPAPPAAAALDDEAAPCHEAESPAAGVAPVPEAGAESASPAGAGPVPAAETESAPAAAAQAAVPPPAREPESVAPPTAVRRHHWIVRLTHWVNTVVLVGMMASGLQVYNAYQRFGIRGTRLPLPNPLDMHPVPRWARLGGWLAGGLNWHFFLMWPLVLNGLVYLGYLLFSGEWRPLLFRPRDLRPAVEMQKYYLHLRREHPPQGKHNALQKGAYSFIVLLGVVSVLSGLSIWKPVQLSWLTSLFGGYELARYWHFVAVWLFAAFIVVHVVLVFAVDPASLRAMITGWYRGRFPSHD